MGVATGPEAEASLRLPSGLATGQLRSFRSRGRESSTGRAKLRVLRLHLKHVTSGVDEVIWSMYV